MAPFAVYIGTPKEGNHPLEHQAKWLSDNRGGMIPQEVMEAVSKLQELAKKNNVPLEELCVYALGTEEEQAALAAENGLDDDEDDFDNEEADTDSEQASDEAIAADNDGAAEDMAEEGGHVEDEELDLEEESDGQDTYQAAEDMAEEGGHVVDEELEDEEYSDADSETVDAAADMAEEGGPAVDDDLQDDKK